MMTVLAVIGGISLVLLFLAFVAYILLLGEGMKH